MKKLLLMLMLCLFLTGCGESKQEEKTDSAPQSEEEEREETAKEKEEKTEEKKEETSEQTETGKEGEKEETEESGAIKESAEEETEEKTDPEKAAEDWETLATESYQYDDGSEMTLLFSIDKDGGSHITIGLEIEEKWKAAYVYTSLDETMQIDAMQELNPRIVMTCGRDVITSYGISYHLSAPDEFLDNTQWLADGLVDEDLDSAAADELVGGIMEDLIDFMTNL